MSYQEYMLLAAPVLAGIVVFAARRWLIALIETTVEHNSKKSIAILESNLAARNEEFRFQLEFRELNIRREMDTHSANKLARYVEADNRTLDAIEQCWSAVWKLNRKEAMIRMLHSIKLDLVLESTDPNLARFFDTIANVGGLSPTKEQEPDPAAPIHRLYLSDRANRLYDALNKIHGHAELIVRSMAIPHIGGKYVHPFEVNDEVIKLLPFTKDGYDKFGGQWSLHVTDALREALLMELRSMIAGTEFKSTTEVRFKVQPADVRLDTEAEKVAEKLLADLPEELKFSRSSKQNIKS